MANAKWYEEDGRNLDVVLSSKAVITRNLKGYKFPGMMDVNEKDEVTGKVKEALADMDLELISMEGIGGNTLDDLTDSQIISDVDLIEDSEGKAVMTDPSRDLAVILNNNDHIKIKAQAAGYTNSVYKRCENVAVALEQKLDIAFSNRYGYLGSSVYNTGLGFKLLFTIAIPGIARTGEGLEVLTRKVKAHDWNIYPFVQGDKSIKCDVYIISSNAALGVDEATVLMTGDKLIQDIIKIELLCRENLRKNRTDLLENSFYRSYGILYYSKSVDPVEALDLLGWIRLYHGYEDRTEVDINWTQINTVTSQLLWQIYPGSAGGNSRSDVKYTAARIAAVLKRK